MEKIVIVDDSPITVEGVKFVIETTTPYSVVNTFKNGKELLDKLDTLDFDILITDLEMPVVTGYDVLKELKEKDIDFPVIVLTNHISKQTTIDLKQLGARAVIEKKFLEKELQEVIERIKRGENCFPGL